MRQPSYFLTLLDILHFMLLLSALRACAVNIQNNRMRIDAMSITFESRFRDFALLFVLAIFGLWAVPAPRAHAQLPAAAMPQGVGVNIHFVTGHERDLDMIAEAGFKFVRMDFTWGAIEREKGKYDWSGYDELTRNLEKRGLRALYILDYSNALYEETITSRSPINGQQVTVLASPRRTESVTAFARWAAAAAERYRDRHIIWEIWNEPNIHFWQPKPNVKDYAALALATSRAIRKADPQATIVGPASSGFPWPFLEECFRAGLLEYLNAVSVHPYRSYDRGPETAGTDYERLRELIKKHAPAAMESSPILSGEWGYATHTKGISPELQAAFLVRQQLANLHHGVPLSIWYDWKNDGQDADEREHHFGTVTHDLKPKPSYRAVQTLTRQLSGYRVVRRLKSDQAEAWVLLCADDSGNPKLAAWSTKSAMSIELPLAGIASKATAAVDGMGGELDVRMKEGRLELKLDALPQYITLMPSEISNQSPDTNQTNSHYPSNRTPLLASPLIKLPVGAVRPAGWLRKQLELQAAGFHGHLTEISKFLVKEKNAWLSPNGSGTNGWEEVPYWLKGFGDCAYLLGNEEQIQEAKVWIEGAIASQRQDGFFGPRGKSAASTVSSTKGKYDLWPNMVMLDCLQSYYEYTGDQRVIELMTRYFKWQLSVPEEDFLPPYWQQQRAADNLWSVYWLYNRTGEKWLLDLAEKIHRHTANWTDGVTDWHNVNMSQAFGGPAFFYPQSKEVKDLQAADRNFRTIREMYGQVPGGMFGGDENCRPGFTDPRQAIETCGMVEMMYSDERLLTVTGNLVWADRCEDVAFNSLPAALTADFKALRYLTAPNLVLSDRQSKSPELQNGGPMLLMNPHIHRCCQHNFGHGWPYFTEHLWLATPENGLAAALYAPSRVTAKVGDGTEITIREETHYPFDEQIELVISTPKSVRFPLYLRVPGWCAAPQVNINGKSETKAGEPLGYIRIDRAWSDGDRVRLTLPMEVSIRKWTKNQNSVSVDRGPLTYSLAIGEKYVREGGTDRWPAWEIHPTTPWNYGLILGENQPSQSFKVTKRPWPESNMPFTSDGTPIELEAQAKRIPEWQLDSLGLVGKLPTSPVRSEQPAETVRLIPMGGARLRISSFPVIGQ
jgi:DUF1680 family protein